MNQWITRGIISVAAGALSTAAIVKSADQSSGHRKSKKGTRSSRKKRKRSKDQNNDPQPTEKPLPEPGLDLETWWTGIKESGARASEQVGKVLKGEDSLSQLGATKEQKVKSQDSKKKSSSKQDPKVSQDGYATLKEEAAHWAKEKVKDTVVKKTGLENVIDAAQEQAEKVKAHGEDLKDKLNESNLSEWVDGVKETGSNVVQSVRDASDVIQENISSSDVDLDDLKTIASEKAKALGVWLEGPGALDYSQGENQEGDVIEAHFEEKDELSMQQDAMTDEGASSENPEDHQPGSASGATDTDDG